MLHQNKTFGLLGFVACGMLLVSARSGAAQEILQPPLAEGPGNYSQAPSASPQDFTLGDSGQIEIGVESEYETLTRGPLHEAFAEPIVANPEPGFIVLQSPPPPINEIAPEFRPDGEEVIWISGYWGWDEQREDFIWISGVYRVPPEGHIWIPGYWNPVDEGWQWVQGFWIEETMEAISYLPPPPETIEVGPTSPSPGPDYFYVPGHWTLTDYANVSSGVAVYDPSGYVWSAGYWHPLQSDLVWIPAHVVWTPRGCVYVNGYWDQRLPMRGLCFAPVAIPQVVSRRPGWSLRPNVVLNAQLILHNLFVQPRYNHYLFGDYYGLPSGRRNVVPAYVYHQSRGSYDPLISFYSAYNARQGQDMIRWYGNQFTDLSRNPAKRPPQIWTGNNFNSDRLDNSPGRNKAGIAHTLDQVNQLGLGMSVLPVTAILQQEITKRDQQQKQFARNREETERKRLPQDAIADVTRALPKLALPKLDPVIRKNDVNENGEAKPRKNRLPEPPRNSGPQTNRTLSTPGMPGNSNAGQASKGIESALRNAEQHARDLPNNLESKNNNNKRPDSPDRLDPNRIPNLLDTNRNPDRVRPSEPNRSPTPNPQTVNPPSIPLPTNPGRGNKEPGRPSLQPNGSPRGQNGQPQLPPTEARKPSGEGRIPNIENRLPNAAPRIRNGEPSQPTIQVPQGNRMQKPNDDRQKPNRGNGPLEGLQSLPRNIGPVQPVVPPQGPAPQVQGRPNINLPNSRQNGNGPLNIGPLNNGPLNNGPLGNGPLGNGQNGNRQNVKKNADKDKDKDDDKRGR